MILKDNEYNVIGTRPIRHDGLENRGAICGNVQLRVYLSVYWVKLGGSAD